MSDLGWPLRRARALYRDSPGVVAGGRTLTYGQLAARVSALGAALHEQLSVPVGGRVGFLGVNSLAHLEAWLAIPAAGRVLVDLNFRLAEEELALIVEDCQPEVLIVDRDRLEVGRAMRSRCTSVRALVLDAPGPQPEDCLAYEELVVDRGSASAFAAAEDELAAISYTGGTTGRPKGVMLSHGNLLANARHNLIATGHGPADRWLHVCPMFHVAGTANVLACTWAGSQQVVLPRFDTDAVLDAIVRERITHTVLVPTMLAMLLEALERAPRGLGSLRHIQYAASPISAALQRRVLERFGCDIVQFYGMTEAAPTVSCATADDHRRGFAGEPGYVERLRSIGAPVIGVEAEVRAPDGRTLAPGEVGEIWVRGPNVMLGYWNQPRATASALANGGWYRSGDAAYADGDGYLYIVDRLKDMIVSGGENVYSIEVETVLCDHAAVREAAVFGVPDPRWGEAVYAVVVVEEESDVTEKELISYARGRIAGFKVPRSVELRTGPLPKSGAGKLLKNVLREPFWGDHDRQVN